MVLNKYEELKDNIDIKKCSFHGIVGVMNYYNRGDSDEKKDIIMPYSHVKLENLSCDCWLIKLTYLIKCVKIYTKHKNGKIYYTTSELYFDNEKKCLCFMTEGKLVFLENYKESAFEIKKLST